MVGTSNQSVPEMAIDLWTLNGPFSSISMDTTHVADPEVHLGETLR